MPFEGMDPERVRAVALGINAQAETLHRIVGDVESLVAQVAWVWPGPDADDFTFAWSGTHRGQVATVAAGVSEAAALLFRQIEQQLGASDEGGVGGVGGGGGWLGAPGRPGTFLDGPPSGVDFKSWSDAFGNMSGYALIGSALFAQTLFRGPDGRFLPHRLAPHLTALHIARAQARNFNPAALLHRSVDWVGAQGHAKAAYSRLQSMGKGLGYVSTALTLVGTVEDYRSGVAAHGDSDKAAFQAGARAAGSIGGAAAGAAIGTVVGGAVGSVFPGPGTVIGGAVGNFVGSTVGQHVGGQAGQFVADHHDDIKSGGEQVANGARSVASALTFWDEED